MVAELVVAELVVPELVVPEPELRELPPHPDTATAAHATATTASAHRRGPVAAVIESAYG